MTAPSATPSPTGGSPGVRVVSDAAMVTAALAAAAGAWWAAPVPLGLAAAGFAGALVTRRPVFLVAAAFLLAASLGNRAWAGLELPPPGAFAGEVTLLTDPDATVSGTKALVRTPAGRADLWARGAPARALRGRAAGDRLVVSGRLTPVDPDRVARWPYRRAVATLGVDRVDSWEPGAWPWRAAGRVRLLVEDGAASLPDGQRALLMGLVLGDDREQTPELRDAFDGAGLTHLLAVSGSNVAFVLAAASPLLRRLRLWTRLGAVTALLVFFALVTRFEPSVLRATAMAIVAATAATMGRPTSGLRVLAIAVGLLILVDPLLVRSLGFQLSVAATGGILLLAGPLARAMPFRRRTLALALSVTLAAQLTTGPLLAARGMSVPVAALVANVLVGGPSGLVMVWGSSAGIVAGVVGGPLAVLIHLPTRALLAWISGVANTTTGWGWPELGSVPLAGGLAGGVAALAGVRWARPRLGRAGVAAVALSVAAALAGVGRADPPVALPNGAELVRSERAGSTVLVLRRPVEPARVLRGLRRGGVRHLDAVVVASGSNSAWRAARPVLDRYRPASVLTARPRTGALVPRPGDRFAVGDLTVTVTAVRPTLRVEVTGAPGPAGWGAGRDLHPP